MAKIKFGATVIGARGTLGGITFSANKSGPYIKQWARSSVPRTTLQQIQRRTWATSTGSWQDMTQVERDAWDTFAASIAPAEIDAFGDPFRISGYAWFTRSVSVRNAGGLSPLIVAPVAFVTITVTIVNLLVFATPSANDSVCNYIPGQFTSSRWFYLFGAIMDTVGATQPNIKMKRILVDSTPANTAQFFQTELENLFGTISVGQRFIWRLHNARPEGYQSLPLTGFVDVVA